jgi:hypothetical protein
MTSLVSQSTRVCFVSFGVLPYCIVPERGPGKTFLILCFVCVYACLESYVSTKPLAAKHYEPDDVFFP